jgi:hypothetical protein
VNDPERQKHNLLKLFTFTYIQTFGVAERRMRTVEEYLITEVAERGMMDRKMKEDATEKTASNSHEYNNNYKYK